MNHHSVRAVLDLRAEGRLTARRAALVERHLAGCPECRALADVTTSPKAAPAAAAGAQLKARLAATLKAAAAAPSSVASPAPSPELALWPRELRGVAYAAAGLVVLSLALGWGGVATEPRDEGYVAAGSLR